MQIECGSNKNNSFYFLKQSVCQSMTIIVMIVMIIIVIRVVRTVGSGRATPLNVPTALRVSFLASQILADTY